VRSCPTDADAHVAGAASSCLTRRTVPAVFVVPKSTQKVDGWIDLAAVKTFVLGLQVDIVLS